MYGLFPGPFYIQRTWIGYCFSFLLSKSYSNWIIPSFAHFCPVWNSDVESGMNVCLIYLNFNIQMKFKWITRTCIYTMPLCIVIQLWIRASHYRLKPKQGSHWSLNFLRDLTVRNQVPKLNYVERSNSWFCKSKLEQYHYWSRPVIDIVANIRSISYSMSLIPTYVNFVAALQLYVIMMDLKHLDSLFCPTWLKLQGDLTIIVKDHLICFPGFMSMCRTLPHWQANWPTLNTYINGKHSDSGQSSASAHISELQFHVEAFVSAHLRSTKTSWYHSECKSKTDFIWRRSDWVTGSQMIS